MSQPTQADFEYARAHPESRNDFTRAVDLEDARQFVFNVRYAGKISPNYMVTLPSPDVISTTNGTKSRILVFPKSFNGSFIRNIDDFISCLVDHEGTHAQQKYDLALALLYEINFHGNFDFEANVALSEYEAYSNQLKNARKRNLSPEFEEKVANNVGKCYDYLREHGLILSASLQSPQA